MDPMKHKSLGLSSNGTRSSLSSIDSSFLYAPTASKEGNLKSQKYVGMKHKVENTFTKAHVKIFNNVLQVDYDPDSFKAGEIPMAWELQLSGLKHVIGPDENGQFSVTAKRESAHLIMKEVETVARKNRRRSTKFVVEEIDEAELESMDVKEFRTQAKERELMGNSKDVCFFFKAPDASTAKEWVDVFNAGKQRGDELDEGMKEKHKSLAVAMSPYSKGGNILKKTRGAGSRIHRKRTVGAKLRSKKAAMEEISIGDEFFPSTKDLPEWQHLMFSVARVFALLLSIVSVSFVGSIALAYMTATNAKKKDRRKIANMLEESLISAIIFILPRTRIHVTGTAPTSYTGTKLASEAPKILIMNRATEVDFLYVAMLANEVKHAGHMRAIVKANLKMLPVVGPLLSWFRFLFLSGDDEADELLIDAYMSRMSNSKGEWLVFFPEPASVSHKQVKRSRKTAEKTGRPDLKKVLLPQHQVLESCLTHLQNDDTEVYDLTIQYKGYSGEVPLSSMGWKRDKDVLVPTLLKLLVGHASNQIHIDSRLWKLRDVVNHENGVQGWLDESFERKDELTKSFIKDQKFPVEGSRDTFTPTGSLENMLILWGTTSASFFAFTVFAAVLKVVRG
mmetsp:Transcript_731/g.898  ORF Transcript_731/g.898 Transcript_731/m.898 type:complete len:620 (-) Transcript_731:733-2592(-)